MLLLLTGCGRQPVFETVDDEPAAPVMASPGKITVDLPAEAASPVLDTDGQQIYFCDGYEIFLENRPSGDLQETVRYLTGFDGDALTVMKTGQGIGKRYEFVWSCAGEEGQRLGRAVVLDDGQYHYCMSILRDADVEGDILQPVFSSFRLSQY